MNNNIVVSNVGASSILLYFRFVDILLQTERPKTHTIVLYPLVCNYNVKFDGKI